MTDDIDKMASAQREAWGNKPRTPSVSRSSRHLSDRPSNSRPIPECPSWVPSNLIKEWQKVCRSQDEFAAAAHIRNLKRSRGL